MIHNREEKYDAKLPWWQHFWISATFLDRDGHSALSNDGRKVWATVLFLSAIMYRKVIQFFSAIYGGPRFVGIQKFCYHGNVT